MKKWPHQGICTNHYRFMTQKDGENRYSWSDAPSKKSNSWNIIINESVASFKLRVWTWTKLIASLKTSNCCGAMGSWIPTSKTTITWLLAYGACWWGCWLAEQRISEFLLSLRFLLRKFKPVWGSAKEIISLRPALAMKNYWYSWYHSVMWKFRILLPSSSGEWRNICWCMSKEKIEYPACGRSSSGFIFYITAFCASPVVAH